MLFFAALRYGVKIKSPQGTKPESPPQNPI
jgi:hypothetical protein